MLIKPVPLILTLSVLCAPVFAQDAMDRAAAATQGVSDLGETFKDGTVDSVVSPFETANPSEAGMDHNTFEDRIVNIRDEDSDQGRVLRATEESVTLRPDVDIDAQGPLMDDANWAHENAEDIAGKYFSSETGQCTTPDIPVSNITDEFCESLPLRQEKRCQLIRQITVDRTDSYRCDIRASTFKQVCQRTNSYSCKVNTTQNACFKNNVRFSAGNVTWSGNQATVTFAAPPRLSKPSGAPSHPLQEYAALSKNPFTISISDRFKPTEVSLRKVVSRGVSQVLLRGKPIVTNVSKLHRYFPNGNDAFGPACPVTDLDGLIVPYSEHFINPANNNGLFLPFASIMHKPFRVNATSFGRTIQLNPTGANVLDSGFDVPNGIGNYWSDRLPSTFILNCSIYADLKENTSISRNLLRYLNLSTYSSAEPQNKRYRSTPLAARVVYGTRQSRGGEISLTFAFDGACCDSFTNTGSESCQ